MRTSNLDSGQCQIERGFLSDELASCSSSTPPCKTKKQWLLTWTANVHCLLPWSYCTAVQSPKAVAAYLKSEQTLSFGFALQCSMTIHERYSVPYIFYYWISGHLKTLTRATPISGVSLWTVLLCKLHLCPPFTDQSLQPGCRRFLRVLVMPGKYWAWGVEGGSGWPTWRIRTIRGRPSTGRHRPGSRLRNLQQSVPRMNFPQRNYRRDFWGFCLAGSRPPRARRPNTRPRAEHQMRLATLAAERISFKIFPEKWGGSSARYAAPAVA